MLMTREFIVDETKKELYKRDMPKNLKYKSFKHYKIFGSRYLVAFGVFPYLLFRDYDVVIVSDPHTFDPYLAFIASKLRRKKFIIWTETFEWKRAKRAMMLEPFVRLMIRFSDVCVAAGRKSREYFIKKGASLDKIFIAPDTTLYYPIKKKDNPPELKNKKVILYLSRIVRYKGLDYLIKAFSKLEKEDKNTFLLIAGNGDYAEEMKELAKKLNIKNIKFIGVVDKEHIGYYYNLCDVFVLPSTFRDNDADCWGLVLNEVMFYGKPVISTTAVGGAYDLIKDGINGYRVRHGSEEEIYAALKKILSNKKLRDKMGRESLKIIKKFNYDNMSKGFEDAIEYSLT